MNQQEQNNQFMQLSDLTNFDNEQSNINPHGGPAFEPISYDESDYSQYDQSFNTVDYLPERNNIEMAIDDYVDPDKPITISNKQRQNMLSVYEMLKKQKEEERASFGGELQFKKAGKPPTGQKRRKGSVSSSVKQVYIPRHKPKKKKTIHSTSRHFDEGGWNHDTRTTGQFDNLQKKELTREKIRRKKRVRKTKATKPKDEFENEEGMNAFYKAFGGLQFKKPSQKGEKDTLYFTDMDQIHNHLEKVDDENLQLEAKNGIIKMEDLEKALEEEKKKRKVSLFYFKSSNFHRKMTNTSSKDTRICSKSARGTTNILNTKSHQIQN